MIDLHVHTTASDGQYTPTEIIEKAKEKKLKAIAITDHDTVAGLEEGQIAADRCGIIFIRGVELNINATKGEFHLLGLGLKAISPSFQLLLVNLIKNRDIRNRQIISKMNGDGVDISIEELYHDFPNTVIGRPHFAAELVKRNIVKTRQQAFDRFLAKGRAWYCERIGSNLDEAIVAITESGGVPVIAHPMSLYLSWGKLPEMIEKIHEQGVAGLEAYHPGARVSECERLEELGRKLGMFITAGSDFHGEKVRADRKLGHTCGGRKIDDKYYFEELLPNIKKATQQ